MAIDEKIFEKLGLTKGEIKVYTALLSIGEATISPIVNESKVSKSKIYDILEKLIIKGFVGYTIKNNIKHFFMNDPKMIIDYLDKKEKEIKDNKKDVQDILPSLLSKRDSVLGGKMAEVYQGFNGMRIVREELLQTLKMGENLLVLGAPKIANDKWEGWLLGFHKERIKKGVGMRIIYNSNAKEYGGIRKKMKLTKVKYFANNLVSPSWIDIFSDAIMFAVIINDEPICFVVRSKELTDSFKAYFEMIWSMSID